MNAAVLWRDIGQAQRAVLEVKYAMAKRQLAQLDRDREALAGAHDDEPGEPAHPVVGVTKVPAAKPPRRTVTTKGAVEVVHADDRWHVMWDGEPEADSIHRFRIEAVVVAHDRARAARCELVIRGRDGATREHVSYHDDPIEQRVIYRDHELRRA